MLGHENMYGGEALEVGNHLFTGAGSRLGLETELTSGAAAETGPPVSTLQCVPQQQLLAHLQAYSWNSVS